MIASTLDKALANLGAAAGLRGPGAVQARDQALAQVTAHNTPTYIGPLLLLLDDQLVDEESMFSLIHAAEAFDDSSYVGELLKVLPELVASSPQWASVVLMRVLNNASTRDTLTRALREQPENVKQAAKWLCEKINERSASFASKTLPVLVASSS